MPGLYKSPYDALFCYDYRQFLGNYLNKAALELLRM